LMTESDHFRQDVYWLQQSYRKKARETPGRDAEVDEQALYAAKAVFRAKDCDTITMRQFSWLRVCLFLLQLFDVISMHMATVRIRVAKNDELTFIQLLASSLCNTA
jgi:hypothetical protein